MIDQNFYDLSTAILGSITASGFIIFAFSSWLGKIWANRIMDTERQKHERELSTLRSDLERYNQKVLADIKHQQEQSIEWFKSDLDIFKDKHLKGFNDKLVCYRELINLIADTLGTLDSHMTSGQSLTQDYINHANTQRLKLYGYTAMIAPQNVMDAQDKLIDFLLSIIDGSQPYNWEAVRFHALNLINEIRKDIAIDTNPILYNGNR
jgi:hypothetical protein